jgi:anti-sigma-K factor RskA
MTIPENPEELRILAGEYVLGVLDAAEAEEVAAALPANDELRGAVGFWREQLHPLSALAAPAAPPPEVWDAIEARLGASAATPATPGFWGSLALWRTATAGFAAAAAALALWIASMPAPGPSLVAVLHPPQQDQASWVVTAGRSGVLAQPLAGAVPPAGRAFELWAIAPGGTRSRSLGVIPAGGEIALTPLPAELRDGATLAISIEPIGGSPTGQPTGPVVFVGAVKGA